MSQKRQPEEGKEGGGSDGNSPGGEKRQKVPALRGVVMEAVKMNAFQKLLSALEPLLRRVVKEEVELALTKHLANMRRHCGKQVHPSVSRNLQLQFMTKLSLPIFTGTKVEGEECCGLSIALVDTLTRKVVMSGPESSMKVEIVVLEGDFEGDEENNWTFEDFKNNIVKEREGKRSLLAGDVFLDLTEGTGVVGELAFTDNSSWTRSRKFKLGARVEDGNFNGMRVREAKTEAFMVKDHRGELYKKHYPPSLLDEVWRLEKIGKDGAFHKRLSSENIHTVKDFLTLLCIDAARLRNILGTGMSAKMWEVTVEHARTCTITSQAFIYYPNAQQKMGVVFNVVGEVLGILSDGQYIPVNDLSETQKVDAHKFVKLAFEHWVDVSPYEIRAVMGGSSYAPSVSFPSGSQQIPEIFYNELSNSHKADGLSYINSSIASPDLMSSIFSMGCTRSLDTSLMPSIDNLESIYDSDFLSADIRDLYKFPNSLMFDAETSSQTFFGEENLQYFDAETSLSSPSLGADSPSDLGTAVAAFLATRPPAGRGKVNTRWRTLISVLRWRFSIKRIVASKRKTPKKVIYG